MPKNYLLILLFLLISFSIPGSALTLYENGGFETGDLTSWSHQFSTTNYSPVFTCVAFANDATISVTNKHPISGIYSFDINDTSNSASCGILTNTQLPRFTGNYNFIFDYNVTTLGGGGCISGSCQFGFTKNDAPVDDWTGTFGNNCFGGWGVPGNNHGGTVTCRVSGTDYNVGFLYSTGSGANGIIGYGLFDNFRYETVPQMVHSVEEEGDPFPIDTNFSITDALHLDSNGMIVSNSTCTITFDGTSHAFPFNSSIQKYEYTYSTPSAKTVSYDLGCSGPSGYVNPDANVTGTVTFTVDLSTGNKLTVTDIENVTHDINTGEVDFFPTNESNTIIYSIENNYSSPLDIPQVIFNSLIDGRQYWIYTATQTQYDAGTWVFDDTLTFGSTSSTPVQKIWNGDTQQYEYSFTDTLFNGELKYYKLSYLAPYKHYYSLQSASDWVNLLQPNQIDGNGILVDQYPINQFTNIRSYYIEAIPDITQDEFQTATYELQFTAWASVNNTIMYAGYTNFDVDNVSSVTLSTEPHRYSVSIDGNNFDSQMLFKTLNNTYANVFITDYAIVPRGYFTKRLELFKSNGDPLDLFLLLNQSEKYLAEGSDFKLSTEAYDVDGKLQTLKVQGFFENTNQDVNQVSEKITDLNTTVENLFTFDQIIDGIIDLNGNAVNPSSPRNLTIKATLSDSDGVDFATQSQIIKFVQFPYFGEDMFLQFFPTEKRKGKNPAGIIQITSKNMDTLEGLDIRIYDQNTSITSPDYLKRIYKGTDFSCPSNDCSFQIKIDDFLYEDANLVHFVITGIMNTEYFSLTNPLIQVDRTIFLSQTTFDTAKIYQTVERTSTLPLGGNQYRNNEEIPLFLVLRTTDAENLKELNIYLTLENCNMDANFLGLGNCVSQSKKWYPTGYLYDDKFNYNVYYFRYLYLLDSGALLPDGNYIGFHAHVTDNKGAINPTIPVLAPRCNNQAVIETLFYSAATLSAFSNMIGFTNGCQIGSQEDVVTTTQNSNQEIRIHINNAKSTLPPSLNGQLCVAPDANNVEGDALRQNLICIVSYSEAEQPIDDFRIRIGNQYSDYSVTGSDKQYVELHLPYELVTYNDPVFLRAELESKGSTITTVGDFFYELIKDYSVNTANFFGLPDKANFLLGNGLIPNVGADVNTAALNSAFSATTVSGIMLVDIVGLPVVNAQDFKSNSKVSGVFDSINKTHFLTFLQKNSIAYKTLVPAQANIVVSDIEVPVNILDPTGSVLINEVATTKKINENNLDANADNKYGSAVPASITFNVSTTMFYNSFGNQQNVSNIMTIYAFFFENLANFFSGFIGNVLDPNFNPIDAGKNFMFEHILEITILLMIMIIYTYVFPGGFRR